MMKLIYKLDKAPDVVEQVLRELGWIEFDDEIHAPDEWNLLWKSVR
jgi:hypothetical protein